MNLFRKLSLFLLLLLGACTDQRAVFEIEGGAHSLSLIKTTLFPWDTQADYVIVASRMPDCMRRHPLPKAGLNARLEIFSPGNNAWILRRNNRMFVLETRTCEGFARLDNVPESGLGPLVGTFEMSDGTLVFTPAPPAPPAPKEAEAEAPTSPRGH